MSASERFGWVVITAASLGVGMLLGGRACAPQGSPDGSPSDAGVASRSGDLIPVSQCPKQLIERTVEAEPRIVYQCPPDPPEEDAKGKGAGKPKKKSLPPPEPELDPIARKRLLAWVRDQSDTLRRCRDDSKEIYRVAVIMHLDRESGAVRRVDVNTTRGETPASLPRCLRQKILLWKPPKEFVEGRTQLVFGLNI